MYNKLLIAAAIKASKKMSITTDNTQTILNLRAKIESLRAKLAEREQPTPSQSGSFAWESTTEAFKKYVTQKQYDMFNDNFKSWYKPYKCNSCANLSKPQPTSQDVIEKALEIERLRGGYEILRDCSDSEMGDGDLARELANKMLAPNG